MSVIQKLAGIQRDIEVPKNQFNKFGGYNYRSCEDILKAAKPLLQNNNCILTIQDDIQHISGRFYIMAKAVLTDCETGETFFTMAYAREEESKKGMDGAQVTGSTSSYARKYALNGLFALDDEKDSDATNKHDNNKPTKPQEDTKPKTQQVSPTKTTSEPQQRKVFGLMKQKGLSDQEMLDVIFGLFSEKPWSEHMEAYGAEGKDFTTGSALKYLLVPEASKLIEDLGKYTDVEGK